MKLSYAFIVPLAWLLIACSPGEESTPPAPQPEIDAAAPSSPSTVEVVEPDVTEEDVEEYIRLFPYRDTYRYVQRYTGGDPARLNRWVLGAEPALVKAGEDRVVRMNNDTFYKMAIVDLREGPVYLAAQVPDKSRFVSFQLMDDHNTNYRNLIFPNGEFTLYHGTLPASVVGEAIAVPTQLSIVIVRVEVKDPGDPGDVGAATAVFRTITIEGEIPANFPKFAYREDFSDAVVTEADYRMDQVFSQTPFRLTVVGPGSVAGEHVSYLNHAAGTRGGWGGPGTEHSSYETINRDRDQKPLVGASNTYTLTTQAPPVDAFWSLTVYDSERGGFLHPNKHDRYHINNTLALADEAGNYTFVFKQDCTAEDSNCLEVPAGRFDIAARYYLPTAAIQSGEWTLPPLELSR